MPEKHLTAGSRPADRQATKPRRGQRHLLGTAVILAACLSAKAAQDVSFNKVIAPILFEHCAVCHRPGRSGPFNLLTYADAKKHQAEIVKVTNARIMPPWLAKEPPGTFTNERILGTNQIQAFKSWVENGSPEGAASDLPPQPAWTDSWELGLPDQVVTLPEPFLLGPDGRDVYRNFVMHVSNSAPRFVRAVEIRPGNPSAHHVFLLVDDTPQSRMLDERDPAPGFNGMYLPSNAYTPGGQFLSWQPGRGAVQSGAGFAWPLKAQTDLLLQVHARPTGKPEKLQPVIGLYFTNAAPISALYKISLRSVDIDIPAGATNYEVSDSYTLPVELELRAIHPHAHYLARRIFASARMPNGRLKPLLTIDDWDFSWQSDFQFAKPLRLPAGTTLQMRFVFDNSEANARNPVHPPVRTRFGADTTNEMAECIFQVRPLNRADLATLEKDFEPKLLRTAVKILAKRLEADPRDFIAHTRLGLSNLAQGNRPEAERHLNASIAINPHYDESHYYLGLLYRVEGKLDAALQQFQAALDANPQNYKAHGNLGMIYLNRQQLDDAEFHIRAALRINPDDEISQDNLKIVAAEKAKKRGKL